MEIENLKDCLLSDCHFFEEVFSLKFTKKKIAPLLLTLFALSSPLYGAKNLTAPIYVNGTTLMITSPTTLGTDDIHVLNQGTLDFLTGGNAYPNNLFMDTGGGIITQMVSGNSLTGPIAGAGSLTYNGTGTLILTNTNSYQGGTMLNSGLVQGCGTSPVGTGAITFNSGSLELTCSSPLSNNLSFASSGTITTDTGTSSTITGTFSGPGGWTKTGTGQLTLIGAGSNQGTTTLNGGTLALSGSNPTGIGPLSILSGNLAFVGTTTVGNSSTNLSASTTITTNPSVTATLNTPVSGLADTVLTLNGTGRLILNGNNPYQGSTALTQGTLQINGTLPNSPITTSVGTVLTGSGTTNALSILGTLTPGNPTGTLTANGSVILSDGSTFATTIDGTSVGALQSTGSVSIGTGTTLSVSPLNITQSAYTIITSVGPIAGTFSNVPSDGSTRFPLTVTYTPNSVVLNFTTVPFSKLVPKGNLQNIATCFDQFSAQSQSATLQSEVNVLNTLSGDQFSLAFNQLDPSLYNAVVLVEQYTAETTRNIFSRHSYDRQFDPKFLGTIWTDVFAGRVDQENAGGGQALSGYKDTLYGALAGIDVWMGRSLVTAGGSYGRNQIRWTDANHALASLNSYTGFLGLTRFSNPVIFDFYGSYTFNDVSGSRDINVSPSANPLVAVLPPPINEHITYKNQSSLFTGHMGLLSTIPLPNTHFFTLAFGNLDYLYVSQHPFKEISQGALALSIEAQTSDLLQPEIGTGIGYYTTFEGEGNILIDFRVSFVKEFRFSGQSLHASFIGNSCSFLVDGLYQNNGLICPSLHILINGVSGFDISFDLRGAYWGRYAETTGKMEFLYAF